MQANRLTGHLKANSTGCSLTHVARVVVCVAASKHGSTLALNNLTNAPYPQHRGPFKYILSSHNSSACGFKRVDLTERAIDAVLVHPMFKYPMITGIAARLLQRLDHFAQQTAFNVYKIQCTVCFPNLAAVRDTSSLLRLSCTVRTQLCSRCHVHATQHGSTQGVKAAHISGF